MKKCVLCLLLALCFLLSACAKPVAEDPDPAVTKEPSDVQPEATPSQTSAETQLSAEPVEAGEDEGSGLLSIYEELLKTEVLPEMMEFPKSMVLDFYGIEETDYTDAVFYQSFDSMLADEVVLILAVDDAAASRIEEMLNTRLEAKAEEAKGYSPEQFAIIEKCSVQRSGRYVGLIVSPEKDKLVEIFKNRIA